VRSAAEAARRGGATHRLRGGGLPATYERKPSGRGRRRRADAPHPQAGGTGRNVPQRRARTDGPGRPPRAGHPVAAQRSPSRAHLRRVARDGASATLDTDLPRQDPGTYREDGPNSTRPPFTLIFHGKTRHLPGGRRDTRREGLARSRDALDALPQARGVLTPKRQTWLLT
jgi:hypothetical protein